MGIRNYQENNLIVAEQIFRDILKAAPNHYQSLYFLGLTCYFASNMPESLKALEQAAAHEEADATCWNNLAIVRANSGLSQQAIEAWDKAIKMDPDFADSYGNKANALWEQGLFAEAEWHARKAVELLYEYPDAWLNLGNALAGQERFDEAMEAWKEALKVKPDYASAYNNMGNALRDMGRLSESEEYCRKALELNPEYPHAMSNLANVLRDLGKVDEAEGLYRQAIAQQPNYVQAHNNLSVCLIDQGRYEEAIVAARYATSFKADYAEAYMNMSVALRFTGKTAEAEKIAQRALSLKPDSAEAHIELAEVLFLRDRYNDAEALLKKAQEMQPDSPRLLLKLAYVQERTQRVEEALESVEKAVRENPEMPEAHFARASICHVANRLDDAIESIQKTIALRPNYAAPYATLSEIYQARGEPEKSLEAIRKAQELNPNLPAIYYSLGKLKKFAADDDDFKKLLEIEGRVEKMGLPYKIATHFALYAAYEHIGDYDKAFTNLKAANDFKRQTIPYQPDIQQKIHDKIKERYTAEFIAGFSGKGEPSDVPVFIVGMPRSGTTLTEQILSSHKDVYGAGELPLLSRLEHEYPDLTPENAAERGRRYVDEVKKLDTTGKALRITDKMPGNFLRLGEIACTLPNAKIIHCRRDAADTALSCYKQHFARGQYWSYDLEELADQYNMYLDLMEHWRKVLPDRFLEVDYEETVGNLEEQARKLVDFVGLPWDPACLEPHKQKRDVLTASKMQVIKPVYKTSVKGWKRYEQQMQPFIARLEAGLP